MYKINSTLTGYTLESSIPTKLGQVHILLLNSYGLKIKGREMNARKASIISP